MKDMFYKSLLDESHAAYAFHKIVLNEQGEPCDYEFIEVNKKFERITDLKAKDIIGKRVTEVLPQISSSDFNWINIYGRVSLTGETEIFDQYSAPLNRWYRVKAYSPEKYYFITSFLDISAETELESALRNFFDISLDMLCITDLEGSFLKVNQAWQDSLGYAEDFMKDKKYIEFVHPDDIESTKNGMKKLALYMRSERFVNRYRVKEGTYKFIEWCAQIEKDMVYFAARDITEIVEEEDRIKNLLAEVEIIFNSTQDALFLMEVLDDGFRYIKNNRAYQIQTGIRSIEGKTPEELWGKELSKNITANYKRCVKEKKPVSYEETLPLPIGYRIWRTTLTPKMIDENPVYIVGSRHDITEEKLAEEELRQNLSRNESLVRILQNDSGSIQEYLDFALEQALNLTQSKYGYIYFYDEDKREFTLNTWSSGVMKACTVKGQVKVYQLEKTGIWGEAVRQCGPVVVNDFQAPNPLKKGYPEGHINFTRFMTIPVINRKSIVAVVGVADKETNYTDIDVLQLTILMNNVWKEVVRRKSEAMLFEEKDRLRITLLSVGDGVISTDADGKIQLMNEVAERLTGWTLEEAYNNDFSHVFKIINEYTREKCEDPIKKVLASGEIIGLANHTVLISKDGTEWPIADSAAPIRQEDGEIKGVVLVFRDITVQRQKQELIEHLSFHDQLTGLYNRRFFEEELQRMDTTRNLPLAIIMADVNGLKLTNDAFGHAVGDKLLMQAALTLQNCCRDDDIIARLGGDEFVILLPNTGEEQAEEIVTRIMSQCGKVIVDAVSLSLSCGCAVKNNSEKIFDVLKKAEDHMYRQKLFEGPSKRGQIIDAVVKALFEANRREKDHSERVSIICEKIGLAMGCADREINELRTAGLLHDIGKVAINVSLLEKSGTLTENEWIEIKRHPEIGYRILSAVNEMSEIAQSILAHHERWDGAGYPRGLTGESIPLHARILAIADAYDAMTKDRPYRRRMACDQAVKEMIRNSGTQFDSKLVQLFLEEVVPSI